MKILTGGQHACQEATQWRKLRAKGDDGASRAGTQKGFEMLCCSFLGF